MQAAILICGFSMSVTSCVDNSDNPVPAKKRYRLVEKKEVVEGNGVHQNIGKYTYDEQGRLKKYVIMNIVAPNDTTLEAYYTYTYEDHLIIATFNDQSFYYYTLNDDGLIIKDEFNWIKDGELTPKKTYYTYQYADGRVTKFHEVSDQTQYTLYWEAGDLMSYEQEEREDHVSKTEFTRTGLSVDHGYMVAPLTTMSDELYMMGYYGKPSKHLESLTFLLAESQSGSSSIKKEYTYTIADGHIVEMVEKSYTSLDLGPIQLKTEKMTTTTFTYEEY